MKYIIAGFFILIFQKVTGQSLEERSIQGIVQDSISHQPVDLATVKLIQLADHKSISSTQSHLDGKFNLRFSAIGNISIEISSIGYNSKVISLNEKTNTIGLGIIYLSSSVNRLNEVVIQDVKKYLNREVDRISYNVSIDPDRKSMSAIQIMRKVPLLNVDASGGLKLNGSANYKILVNGKESLTFQNNLANILASMPAEDIKKIEVITAPPAKYDAEGLVGIINIITRKLSSDGYNLGLNGMYHTYLGPALNINTTVKHNKLGFSAFAGYAKQIKQDSYSGNTQTFAKSNNIITQASDNSAHGKNMYANADISYDLDSLNLLTGSFQFSDNRSHQNNSQVSNELEGERDVQGYYSNNQGYNKKNGIDVNLNYQLGFKDDKKHILTFSYKYASSPNSQFDDLIFSERVNFLTPNYKLSNEISNKENTVQIDFVKPFKTILMEVGGKMIRRNNQSDYLKNDYNDSTRSYVSNTALSNEFEYQQNIFSIYNSYELSLKKWTFKGGVRLESTKISTGSDVANPFNSEYQSLIPSVQIQRRFEKNSINFAYTNRIQRPGMSLLNPFVNTSNPLFISTGNPYLRPELLHLFEVDFSDFSKGSLNLGFLYSFSNNAVQNVSSIKPIPVSAGVIDSVTVNTYENLSTNKNIGFHLSLGYLLFKKIDMNFNGRLNHLWLSAIYDGQTYKSTGLFANVDVNLGYKFKNGIRLTTIQSFDNGDKYLQGKSSAYFYHAYIVSKELLSNKASLSFAVTGPNRKLFSTNSYFKTQEFYLTSYNRSVYRSFSLRFTYNIGRLKNDISRSQKTITNDDVKK